MDIHEKFMKKAILLALKGQGNTSPNPLVGAIVVKNNKIIGKGYHKKAGDAHAEINALNDAGRLSKGSDLYVTLEPCSHYGKTPPCVNAIIDSKIKNVFIGSKDINPLVNGKGIKILKKAGINVFQGILESECESINESYFFKHKYLRPMFIAKAAVSCDGKIAAKDGTSKWISSETARLEGHDLRLRADVIMIGAETLRNDNPRLTVRIGKKEEFKKVAVVSKRLNIPLGCNLFPRPDNSLFIFTTKNASANKVRAWGELGANVLQSDNGMGEINWKDIISKLNEANCNSVLVEGGGGIISSLIKNGLLDKIVLFVAPIMLGGTGKDLLPNIEIPTIEKAVRLRDVKTRLIGNELRLEGKPCLQD